MIKHGTWGLLLIISLGLVTGLATSRVSAQTQAAPLPDAATATAIFDRMMQSWLAGEQSRADVTERIADWPPPKVLSRLGPPRSVRFIRVENNDYVFEVEHQNGKANWHLYFAKDAPLVNAFGWGLLPPFPGDVPLANPDAWGPLAGLANRSFFIRKPGSYFGDRQTYFRVTDDGDAMYQMVIGSSGNAVPQEILRLAGNGVIVRRRFQRPGATRETFYRGQAMDDQTVRWGMVGQSQDYYHDWTVVEDLGKFFLTAFQHGEMTKSQEWTLEAIPHEPEGLSDAIAQMRVQDQDIVPRFNARWAEFLANNSGDQTSPWARALYAGLSAGVEAARESEARSRAELDATLARAWVQADPAEMESTDGTGTAPNPAGRGHAAEGRDANGSSAGGTGQGARGLAAGEAGSVAPATVLLAKGFQVPITPGATSNEMCFALVSVGAVTTGDGRPGEARRAAAGAEQRFLAACRALGQVSSGDFADEWYVDEKAESAYARLRTNRWMHEVDVD